MNNLATVPIAGLSTVTAANPPIAETLQVLLSAAWRQRYLIVTPMLFLPWPAISRRKPTKPR